MTRWFILLIFLLLPVLASRISSQELNTEGRLRNIVDIYGQADVIVPYTTRSHADFLSRHLSVHSVRDKKIFITLSPLDLDWFLSLNLSYEIAESKGLSGLVSASDTQQAMEWDTYPTYTQYDSIMRKFTDLYPSLCKLDTIGTSLYGKLILVLKISDNVHDDEEEPEVFYTSTMHGDETGGFVLMLHLIDYILSNYETLQRVRDLADNLEIWINPLANPDGTYRTGNIISSPVRFNSQGVDLNRNFPDPLDPYIIVPHENLGMISFMREHHFVISANFHAGAEVVNYPWDRYFSRLHADDDWFYSISRAYADTVHNYSTPDYMNFLDNGVTRGAEWYLIYGGRQDFVTSELQGREVTIELDDIKITPAAQLGLLWLYNSSSMLGYLENAFYGIHGFVRDSITLEPLSAKVFISGHDTDSSHVYSDTIYGSFVRMLAPGTYDLIFSAEGYKEKTIRDVNVFNYQKTDLVVDLEADPNGLESLLIRKPVVFPNPASDYVTVILPEGFDGYVRTEILTSSGLVLIESEDFYSTGSRLSLSVSTLADGNYFMRFTSGITGLKALVKLVVVK